MHGGRLVSVTQISVGTRCWLLVVFECMPLAVVGFDLVPCCHSLVELAIGLLSHLCHPRLLLCYFLLLVLFVV